MKKKPVAVQPNKEENPNTQPVPQQRNFSHRFSSAVLGILYGYLMDAFDVVMTALRHAPWALLISVTGVTDLTFAQILIVMVGISWVVKK